MLKNNFIPEVVIIFDKEMQETETQIPAELELDWIVKKTLKRGGQAVPVLLENRHNKLRAVLKCPSKNEGKPLERFLREVSILTTLRHGGVIPVIAYSENPPYLITPFGETLSGIWRRLKNEKSIDQLYNLSFSIIHGLIDVLKYCHSQNVIHRDIKPANIIFLNSNIDEPKLIDFGIAYTEDEERITEVDEGVGNKLSSHPRTAYGKIDDPGAWIDVRSIVYLWAWLLSDRTRWNLHYKYHKFILEMGYVSEEIRALWALVEVEIGPSTMGELEQYVQKIGQGREEMQVNDESARRALEASRKAEAWRKIKRAEAAELVEAIKIALIDRLTILLEGVKKIVDQLSANNLDVRGDWGEDSIKNHITRSVERIQQRSITISVAKINFAPADSNYAYIEFQLRFNPIFEMAEKKLELVITTNYGPELMIFIAPNGDWRSNDGDLTANEVLQWIHKQLTNEELWGRKTLA